ISFRFDVAEQRQMEVRPDQVDAHQQRQKHADEHRGQRQKIILQADDFMIETENPLADEPLRCCVSVSFVGREFPGSHYCFSASRAANHLSKSSCLTPFTMPSISCSPTPPT